MRPNVTDRALRAILLVLAGFAAACQKEESSSKPAPAAATTKAAPPAAAPAAPTPKPEPAAPAPKPPPPAEKAAPAKATAAAVPFKPEVLPLPADAKEYAPVLQFARMEIPADNALSAEKAALGRQLFFDTRLSGDGKRSCYGCHVCEHGLTDGVPLNKGAFDKPLTRHSPTLWNIGFHHDWYWDGRAKTLEAQALAAWKGVNMGANADEVAVAVGSLPGYAAQFQSVFGGPASADTVCKALAAYMRTIISGSTAWDRYLGGETAAVSESAKRGFEVFKQSACDQCHTGALFTDLQYHNVGIGMTAKEPDVGRFKVTNLEQDTGAFKTPTLRDVSRSAPYFHDGSVPTLEAAVDGMLKGGIDNPYKDARLKKVELSAAQRADLLEFLKALDQPCDLAAPPLPPSP